MTFAQPQALNLEQLDGLFGWCDECRKNFRTIDDFHWRYYPNANPSTTPRKDIFNISGIYDAVPRWFLQSQIRRQWSMEIFISYLSLIHMNESRLNWTEGHEWMHNIECHCSIAIFFLAGVNFELTLLRSELFVGSWKQKWPAIKMQL